MEHTPASAALLAQAQERIRGTFIELIPNFCAKLWEFKTAQIALSGMLALAVRGDATPSIAASRSARLQP